MTNSVDQTTFRHDESERGCRNFKKSACGSVAAVCRNGEGLFLGAPAIVFKGIHDPATLEALVVQESMALAEDLHLQAIHVATDCKVIVEDIKQKNMPSYGAIISEIIEYSLFFE